LRSEPGASQHRGAAGKTDGDEQQQDGTKAHGG
jgi:hypothetical protein